MAWLVNADQLEGEIGQTAEIDDDDGYHTQFGLSASEEGSQQQEGNCDRNGRDGQSELNLVLVIGEHQELDGESEEKKEIKFQQSDVNLVTISLRWFYSSAIGQLTW